MRKHNLRKNLTAVLVAVLSITAVAFSSCKKTNTSIYIIDKIPSEVLPAQLYGDISTYMTIYEGTTPPSLDGQFLSTPHQLLHSSNKPSEDSSYYYDRYVAFKFSSTNGIDFYGKQWDDSISDGQGGYHAGFYEEHHSKLKITGTGNNFSCYYVIEGYPNGLYAKQSTIFSGTYMKGEGIKDFKVAVILLETSGNPHLEPVNSYRVLGDADGMAKVNNWLGKSSGTTTNDVIYDNNAFNIFRKK